jgi:ppGpp synthetase/RelA/SpoT-type nucleotidyltranferase
MIKFPEEFRAGDYVSWHIKHHPTDQNFEIRLDQLRSDLKTTAIQDLEALDRIMRYFFGFVKNESPINIGEFQFPLTEAIANPEGEGYDFLFKSFSSIVNKLWRKNKGRKLADCVTLANIGSEITDLIRTEIITESLATCRVLAEKLDRRRIYDNQISALFDASVARISIEPEMKMSSGYFAYHVMFYFKSGNSVEVQIYSAMMKKWRDLSHHLYEKVRLAPSKKHNFGTMESRMVSLGHLLHLAECEIERLQDEIARQSL